MRDKTAERIRQDLEQRGVAPEFSQSVSSRLERFTHDLTPESYEAVLSGVAMAYGVHRQGFEGRPEELAGVEEVQRLMRAFVDELHKLEETVETLAAYVTRMRTRAQPDCPTLH